MIDQHLLVEGDVLHLAVDDYKFGTLDPLRLRVGEVVRAHRLGDGWWIEVTGVMLGPDGAPVRSRPHTLVRADAVGRSRCAAEPGTC